MRAAVVTRFGSSDVLQLGDLPEPEPGPGEVSIDVAYAGLNFADTKIRRGEHYLATAPPFVLGREVSGRVRALGEGVTDLVVGDLASARTPGAGYAEVAIAKAQVTMRLDPSTPDEALAVAAVAPTAVGTSVMLLEHVARVRTGQAVLMHGAAGGLGLVLGQLGTRAGATMLGTVSSLGKEEPAREAGYRDVLLRQDFAEAVLNATDRRGVDVVVDPIGGAVRATSLDILAPLGVLIAIGETSSEEDLRLSGAQLRSRNAAFAGVSLEGVIKADPILGRTILRRAVDLALAGDVTFPRLSVYPLARASDAHAALEGGSSIGKLVLDVRG